MADQEDRSEELEGKLDDLQDSIDDAEKKLQQRKDQESVVEDVAGDWEDEQATGGEDPAGAPAEDR